MRAQTRKPRGSRKVLKDRFGLGKSRLDKLKAETVLQLMLCRSDAARRLILGVSR